MKTQIEKSNLLAEVELIYKSKIKKADRIKIKSSKDAADYFKSIWNHNTIEHVESSLILLLNRAGEVLGWAKISVGGVSGTVVDKKIVFQLALNANASAIILAHNHPSGNLNPSFSDIAITKEIVNAGKLLDISVLDHLILTEDNFTSLKDEGHF